MANSKNSETQNSKTQSKTEPSFKAALEASKEGLYAMTDEEVAEKPSLDAGSAAKTGEANAVTVAPFRGEIVATFGEPAGELVDELAPAARAAKQADIEHKRANTSGDLSAHHEKVSKQYDLLMTDAQSLVNRGHVSERELAPARNIQGHQAKIDATLILVSLYRDHWELIEDHTPVTKEMVDEAERVAQEMNTEMAYRDHHVNRAPTGELRNRALTRLVILNESLRRMITYIRWNQGDADEIVRSFWAGRSRSKRGDEPSTPADPTDPTPTEPDLDPTAPGGPFTP